MYHIESNDIYGRFLVASRDLKAGEVILEENPIIIGSEIEGKHICFKCATILERNLLVCKKCGAATICSHECEGIFHPEDECESLKNFKIKTVDFLNVPQIITVLRCLLLKSYKSEIFNELMMLESHENDRKGTPIWNFYNESIVKIILNKFQTNSNLNGDIIQKICAIFDVNCFELRAPNLKFSSNCFQQTSYLRGLYIKSSLMTHDCVGNTHLSIDNAFKMTIRASLPIQKGEKIYFNYGNCLKPTHERLLRLESGKYFRCKCKRCSDPTELNTNFSSVKCLKCKIGLIVPLNPLNDVFNDIWKCQNCQNEVRGEMIKTIFNVCEEKIEEFRNEINFDKFNKGEKLLKHFLTSLSENNFLIIELKQLLVSLIDENQHDLMFKKIDFIENVLEVTKVFELGISRLQALGLYQLQKEKLNLSRKLLGLGKLNNHLKHLLDVEEVLVKSLGILVFEPKNSPEGELFKTAVVELKELRKEIQKLKI
ncbi:SET domain-containing protein SmydA-8-like isoform X1 [Onthophagus taurus]|uniref:SET domain-containing protein SmydA-8-like isoform X1 n=1 Tax=Onthophagus taurus TaxID=166361 RepID=UPI0039BDA3AA